MAAHSSPATRFRWSRRRRRRSSCRCRIPQAAPRALDALACGLDIRAARWIREVLFSRCRRTPRLIAALWRRLYSTNGSRRAPARWWSGVSVAPNRHVRLVDAGLAPNTTSPEVRVRHGGVHAAGRPAGLMVRVGDHRPVFGRLFLRLHDDEALRVELPFAESLVAGDDGRAVT